MYGEAFEMSDEALSPDFLIPIGKAKIERPGLLMHPCSARVMSICYILKPHFSQYFQHQLSAMLCLTFVVAVSVFRPRRFSSTAAYSRQTFPWMICRSVRTCVGWLVCPMHCGKTADRIRMPFGIIGWTGPGLSLIHI